MKGLTHFAIGVAAASCFPRAVEAGAAGNPLYLVLGGVCGLLPDTLDFKFSRLLYRHDIEVQPDPNRPDASMVAQAVALAVNRAAESGRPIRIKLNTVRLGANLWQQYRVTFDVERRRVDAEIGPAVNTSQQPVGRPPPGAVPRGSAPLAAPVSLDYFAATDVDIFDGPVFEMRPLSDGRVRPIFIPWHRTWSHSLVTAAAAGGVVALAGNATAGLIAFAGWAAHALADQIGFLGSALFYPLRRRRTHGMGLIRSTSAMANFSAVWAACLLIFWNLYAGMNQPGFALNPIQLAVFGGVVPAGLFVLADRWLGRLDARRAARAHARPERPGADAG